MKIVINTCHGGFGLSKTALALFNERAGAIVTNEDDIKRNNPILVEIVEQIGETANGGFAKLKVVKIPDDVQWQIEEYDGVEWVAETHRIWN
jgi:hypothetical protein